MNGNGFFGGSCVLSATAILIYAIEHAGPWGQVILGVMSGIVFLMGVANSGNPTIQKGRGR